MGKKTWEKGRFDDLIQDELNGSAKQLITFTRAIYRGRAASSKPEHVGSCVLLKVGGAHFVVSAAHVFDERDRGDLFWTGNDKFVSLDGEAFFGRSPSNTSRSEDRLDVGFLRLDRRALADAAGETFLDVSRVNSNDTPAQAACYVAIGFPISKSETDRARKVGIRAPMLYMANPDTQSHSKAMTDPATHYLLKFNRSKTIGDSGVRTAPKLQGMSGGALWRFASLEDRVHGRRGAANCLVGILTEHRSTGPQLIVATRISVVLELIRYVYSDLSALIPVSSATSITVTKT